MSDSRKDPVGSWSAWIEERAELIAAGFVALGFCVRVLAAWGTFLNPDEALHFFIANRSSLGAVYQASHTMAHPPLLFLVIYWLRPLGTSEFALRLPTILCGTAFCWVFFRWLTRLAGRAVGLVGLIFVALLPPIVSVTAQVRQYGLLLLFLMLGAHFLELAFAADSPVAMAASAVWFSLALFSHYSAIIFVGVVGIYSLLRVFASRISVSTLVVWIAGEIGALAEIAFLFVTHISKIKHTTMAEQAFDGWLRKSYFHRGQESVVTFVFTRTFSLFQYMFGQLVIGDLITVLFIVGIILLIRGRVRIGDSAPGQSALLTLVVLPFVLNCTFGLLDIYPYGGTRHCMFLVIFALPVVATCVVKIGRQDIFRGMAIAVLIVALSFVFRTNHAPYIAPADQSRAHMVRATAFMRQQIPAADTILTDYESGIELGHYLCDRRPVSYQPSPPNFLIFDCGGHRIISTDPDLWAFVPSTFLNAWEHLTRSGYVEAGETLWVVQAGWMVSLGDDLGKDFPELRDLKTQTFGNNIRVFPLLVGRPMPVMASSEVTPKP
jgi:Dolichyl-phosphate-mannose-protein mannosyltransferase